MNGCIYGLICPISNEIRYIGQTKQKIKDRLRGHIYDKRHNQHKVNWLNKLKKLGFISALKIEILEECQIELLNEREQFWIEVFKENKLVNKTTGGDCNYRITEDVIKRVSEKLRGRTGNKLSDETKLKISESHKGKELSEDHKKSISDGLKLAVIEGRKVSPEMTEEYKQKISKGLKRYFTENPRKRKEYTKRIRKPLTTDQKVNMSEGSKGSKNPFYGKNHSIETKKMMSDIKIGKYLGESNPFYGKKHNEDTKKFLSNLYKNKLKKTIYATDDEGQIIEFNYLDELNEFLNVNHYMNVLRNHLNKGTKFRGFFWTK
jgi:group I intron endonuclease